MNVMQKLADGAGIYTIGNQPGTILKFNYVHDISRSKNAVGSRNNGFFFDEHSQNVFADSNIVVRIENEDYRFNTDSTKIKIGKNYFEKKANISRSIDLYNSIKDKVPFFYIKETDIDNKFFKD
jgi:hypothetical protein